MFCRVKADTVIWETKDSKRCASKVFTDRSAKNASLYLMDGKILHFERGPYGEPWIEISHRITLYINRTSSTIFYDFVHDGETRTFTAKPGFLFSQVILSGTLSDETFWNAKTDKECSTKVIVYGVESTIKNFNIFLNTGDVKHFHEVDLRWVSTTTIVLDINTNSNNDLFDYRSTRGFGHFNPKANLTITKIVKKELEIWDAKDKDYGLKVVLMGAFKQEKHISILLQSGEFVLLHKSGKGQPWVNITQNKHNFSGVKLYSLEEGTSQYTELTRNDYDPIVFECRYGYEFKDGVRCVRITLMGMVLWNHTEDTEFGYARGLYLDLRRNQFIVKSFKEQTKELDVKIDVSKAKITPAKVTPVTAPAKPTPVTLDIEKKQTTEQIDYKDDNGVVTYTPKSGYLFNKVAQGTKVIWASFNEVYAELVRTKETRGINYLVVLQNNCTFSLFQEGETKWTDITKERHDVKKLKFFGEGDRVIKASDYEVSIVDMSFSHAFKAGVNCKKVKLGQEVVWSHTDDPKFPTITAFSLGLASNCFFIKNASGDVKKIEQKVEEEAEEPTGTRPTPILKVVPADKSIALDIEVNKDTNQFEYSEANYIKTFNGKDDCVFEKVSEKQTVIWESEGVSGTMVRTKLFSNKDRFLVILMEDETFAVFKKPSGGSWSDVTCEKCDVKKLRFYGESDREIKRSEYRITLSDLSFSHMFNTGVRCEMVKLGDEVVWRCTEDKKFEDIMSFSLGLVSNRFFVKNKAGELKKLEHKPAVEPPVVKAVAPVSKVSEPVVSGQVASVFHKHLRLCKSDPVDPSKSVPVECEVLEYPNADSLLYLLGSECSQLLFDGMCVWQYTCGPYPTSLYFKSSDSGPLLYLNFDPYYYLYIITLRTFLTVIKQFHSSVHI